MRWRTCLPQCLRYTVFLPLKNLWNWATMVPLTTFWGKGESLPHEERGRQVRSGVGGSESWFVLMIVSHSQPYVPYHRSPFRSKRKVSRIHEAKIALKWLQKDKITLSKKDKSRSIPTFPFGCERQIRCCNWASKNSWTQWPRFSVQHGGSQELCFSSDDSYEFYTTWIHTSQRQHGFLSSII